MPAVWAAAVSGAEMPCTTLSHQSLFQFCCWDLHTLMQLHWKHYFCWGPSYSGRVKTLSDQIILKKNQNSHIKRLFCIYIYIHSNASFRDKDFISTFLRPFFLPVLPFWKRCASPVIIYQKGFYPKSCKTCTASAIPTVLAVKTEEAEQAAIRVTEIIRPK